MKTYCSRHAFRLRRSPCPWSAGWLLIAWAGLTPLLAHADSAGARFNVRTLGATGNGTSDDAPAINRAIEMGVKAGPGAVVFLPAGRYLLQSAAGAGMLEVNHAQGLTLEGEKGTLLVSSDPRKHIVHLDGCRNVVVRRLTMDRHPLVFTQGRVIALNEEAKTADVTIDAGYDEPDAPYLAPLKSFLVFADAKAPTWDHSRWWPAIVARQRLAPGRWRLTFNEPLRPGDLNHPWLLWDNTFHGWGVMMDDCRDCTAEDIAYYGGGADAGIGVWGCTGTILYRNFFVGVPPGSNRLLASAGGGQEFENRGTFIMDGCDISRVDDDGCNIGTSFSRVLAQADPRTLVVEKRRTPYQAGDTIALWDWTLNKERTEAKLISFAPEGADRVRLTLDRDVQALHPASAASAPVQDADRTLAEHDGIDRVVDFQTAGRLIVRNCRIQSMRARDVLVKSSDSLIENNVFYDTHMTAILVGPEFYWGEGPAVKNLVIRNNRFLNNSGSSINLACHDSNDSYDNRNIVIEGNTFENYGATGGVDLSGIQGTAVLIRNADGVTVRHNTFGRPAATAPVGARPLVVEVSRNVVVRDNRGLPTGAPAQP